MSQKNILAIGVIVASIATGLAFTLHWVRTSQQVTTLVIATGSKGGEYYAFGQAFAEVVAKHNPKIQLEVRATQGSAENDELITNQQVQLAIIQGDTVVSPDTKAITFLFPEVFHLIAQKSANINQVPDLRGKRIALMPQGSGSYVLFWSLANHYGLQNRDFEVIPMTPDEAHQALTAGKVDALFRVIALGNQKVFQLLQNPELQLVPIEQGAALQLSVPGIKPSVIPTGTYNGSIPIPSQDLSVVAVPSVLVTSAKIDSAIIQELTRILFEARNELIKLHPASATITKPDYAQELGFSFHPGAQAYYNQDEPSFLERYAESIGLVMSISMLLLSGIWQIRLWFEEKQKDRADLYNLEILKLIDKVLETKDLEELKGIRDQLFKIFEKVVIDLDKNRISPESFQSFTFPWEVAVNSIRHQEVVLINQNKKSGTKVKKEESTLDLNSFQRENL